jgi:hypothetical protein
MQPFSIKSPVGQQTMEVDQTNMALRASIRPLEHLFAGNILGHYALDATSGALTIAAANSQLFAVRWADTTKFMVLMRLAVSAGVTTAFTTGQPLDYELILIRSYSANASGGTQITPTAPSQRMRSSNMGPSIFSSLGDIRVCTTGALTAGAGQVLDTAGIAYGSIPGNAGGTAGSVELYNWRDLGKHPVVLGLNEGFAVRNPLVMGAVGVVKVGFTMEWAEVASF